MSKIVRVELAMMMRSTKVVTVQVPDDFDSWNAVRKKDMMSCVYEMDDGEGFSDDRDYSVDEGTHCLLGDWKPDAPDFVVNDDGEVV